MKLNGRRMLKGALVALVLLVGVGSTIAEAHGIRYRRVIFHRPYRPYWWDYQTVRVVDPIASKKEQGYSDGRDQGKDDAKAGKEYDPDGSKRFDKSESHAYREAFLIGYADGYRKQTKKAE